MSSRAGPRAMGTDGSDYGHREQVASHYKDSVKWKNKLKLNLFLHLLVAVLGALWAALGYLKIVQYEAQTWHMAWLCTVFPVLIGLKSLSKNKHSEMYIYVVGSLVLGFGPLIYGASKYLRTMIILMHHESQAKFDFKGLSVKLALVGLIVQMQITALYYAVRLIGAWKSKGEKKSS